MNLTGKISNIVIGVTLMLTSSCAATTPPNRMSTAGDIPDWVNNPHKAYPEAQYIVGVGSSDTRNGAEKNAIGNIAKVFQAVINVDETLIENYLESEREGKTDFSFSSQMLNRTSIGSQQELKNIKIDKVHFSSKDGLYYSLAYLDRAETAVLYKQDIKNNDQKITEYFDNYKKSTNKLNQYAYLNRCRTITAVNDLLRNQFQIITRGQEQIPVSIPISEIDREMKQLLDRISVALLAEENTPSAVGDYLNEVIGKFGFKIVTTGADFTINYGLSMNPTELNRENVVAYNWKLTVGVQDNVNNFALKSFNMDKRTTAISEGEVQSRIMRTVQSVLQKDFYKNFQEYLSSF